MTRNIFLGPVGLNGITKANIVGVMLLAQRPSSHRIRSYDATMTIPLLLFFCGIYMFLLCLSYLLTI